MGDLVDVSIPDPARPTWENMISSPTIEKVSTEYKLKLRYKGFFKMVKNSNRRKYCFGSQKCIYINTWSFDLNQLNEEVFRHYSSRSNLVLSTLFVDKYAIEQSFIELNSDENFKLMFSMYAEEKEITIYVTTNKNFATNNTLPQHVVIEEPHGEADLDHCSSDESYFSHDSGDDDNGHDDEDDEISSDKVETNSYRKKSITMKVNSKFQDVHDFRRALNHHAIINEFEYFIEKSDLERLTARCVQEECPWRIHSSLMQDKVTFEVKILKETHTCTRSNMGGNKHATQGWIASVLTNKIKSDGDATVIELRKWLMKNYNVNIPYHRVFRGKEQAYTEVQWCTCFKGFLAGCRPYISFDAWHLKGRFNGVHAAATGIDGNNSLFPVAYGVLESENGNSWTWFLESLKKAIGTPDGLVISSDMQKGLDLAIMQVYPNVEHRECMRHVYSNFKKKYRGDFFRSKLWGAAYTYCVIQRERLLKEISCVSEDAISYLSLNHNKIWSRSKFGTASKCDYVTNNVSEAFNAWIGPFRFQPVLDLLDNIREELLKRFDEKRMLAEKWNGTLVPKAKKYLKTISKKLGEYEVCRSNANHAEVKRKGKRWVVMLDEKKCSCRVWQVKGLPCVHAAAFIAFTRESYENYIDPYFTIEKFKDAYALEIATMPGKDKWVHQQIDDKIYPPVIKRPIGRPRKKRIPAADEPKKKTPV